MTAMVKSNKKDAREKKGMKRQKQNKVHNKQ